MTTQTVGWDDLSGWSVGAAFIYTARTKGGCCTGISFGKTPSQYAAQALAWSTALRNLDTSPPNHLVEHQYYSTFFVYDWIHDTLDANTRTAWINYWKSLDTYAPVMAAFAGNAQWANEQLSRGTARRVLAGLACAGDGIDDAWCQAGHQMYTAFIRHPINGMVSRETQRGGTDGSWIQGIGYGLSYDAHHLAIAEMGWRPANGISKASHYTPPEAGYWLGMSRLATYFQRPWAANSGGAPDGPVVAIPEGCVRETATSRPFSGAQDLVWWGLMRRELQGVDDDAAALAAWTINHRAAGSGTDKRFWIHTKFLGANNTEKSPSVIGLPLNKAFKFGAWMWRTGWTSINDALVTVFGYEFSGFRSAVGSFSIDYMGPSIILPGSGGHDIDAAWHGFANSLGAPENRSTSETGDPENNDDFGFHRAYNPITPNFVQNTHADWLDRTERFVAGSTNEDYGYLWLNRTRSMNSQSFNDSAIVGNLTKISSAVREFAVFPPATPGTDPLRVIISDRMTTVDTKFEKRWVLYYSGTPVVNGTPTAGPARGNPSTATGKTTYTGASLITAPSGEPTANNKTYVKPIFPAGSKVVLVNFRRSNLVEDSYGLMHPTSGFNSDDAPYVSSYRTEIIPASPQLSDHFINVIEVGPSSGSPSLTEPITGTTFKGARVGNRIAVFGTSDLAPAGNFVIPSAGTYRVLISDLGAQAARTVTAGGNITSLSDIASGQSAGLRANPQGVLYLQVVVTADGSGAANTITLGPAQDMPAPPLAPTGVRVTPPPPGSD